MGASLVVIGIGCMIAGIVGGGIKLNQLEVGTVKSVWRQIMLFVFGGFVTAFGAGIQAGPPKDRNAQAPAGPAPAPAPVPASANMAVDSNGSAPVPLGPVPPSAGPSGGTRLSQTPFRIAGRWRFREGGQELTINQVGSLLFIEDAAGARGTGTLFGSEAKWEIKQSGVFCRAEVLQGGKMLGGACTQSGGDAQAVLLTRIS